MPRPKRKAAPVTNRASNYQHTEATQLLKPEVGTQPLFKKKKEPATYRYDSSLSPALDWDNNPAREQGEALLRQMRDAKTLDEAKAAAAQLAALGRPFLNWTGKAERLSFDVPTLADMLSEAIRPDTSAGEAPELPVLEATRAEGSTREVDGETSRDVRDVNKSHVNRVVLDTRQWEQSAAYHLDTHPKVEAFVKNWRLGFGILYLADEKMRTYEPDFIVRCIVRPNAHLILETKMARDDHKEAKRAAALRWCAAVTASGKFGKWSYEMVSRPEDVRAAVGKFAAPV